MARKANLRRKPVQGNSRKNFWDSFTGLFGWGA